MVAMAFARALEHLSYEIDYGLLSSIIGQNIKPPARNKLKALTQSKKKKKKEKITTFSGSEYDKAKDRILSILANPLGQIEPYDALPPIGSLEVEKSILNQAIGFNMDKYL